jgi:serine protease Do
MDEKLTHSHRIGTRSALTRNAIALACGTGIAAGAILMAPAWLGVTAPAQAEGVARGPAGFADVVQTVKPAVIGVRAKVASGAGDQGALDDFFNEFDGPKAPNLSRRILTSQGSGFFISPDGFAVTNNHVVENSKGIEIQTDDQKSYPAKLVGTDPVSDIALIKVDGRSDFPYVKLGDKPPRVGDWILAVGNPFGLGGSVTAGIVSARDRDIGASSNEDLIQIDAPINKGDSGGPSFDMDGNVVGVNTMIVSPTGGSIGIAFAIPAESVKNVVAQLKDKGSVARGWLGVQIQNVTPQIAEAVGLGDAHGALVSEADDYGPAAHAGVLSGDIITAVDGSAVKDSHDLVKKVSGTPPGSTVKIALVRDGAEKSLAVRLGQLPATKQSAAPGEPQPSPSGNAADLGLKLAPAGNHRSGKANNPGVVVTEIDPNGRAADSGFQPGDVIMDVGGRAVHSPDDVHRALKAAQSAGKQNALLRLRSKSSGTRFVTIALGPT